jgi:hypothetical protein
VFIEDGARLAMSMISSITARDTGCFFETTHAFARLYQRLKVHSLAPPLFCAAGILSTKSSLGT